MATGGAARESVKGSDEFYPFMCSPCSKKGIDVGAEVYCIQCEEYMCGKCLNSHNSFTKMAVHTMLDRAQMEAKGPLTAQPLLAVPCDLHPGQMYTLFCEKHDQVCCAVCFPINHKSCDVRYILDVAKKAVQGPELNNFRKAMQEIVKHLEEVKKQRELDVQRMTEEKTTEINKIRSSIQQMIKELEAIESEAIDDVTKKFTEFKTKIENDITKLGTMIDSLNAKIDKLEKANDDTEKFVHMKVCEKNQPNARNLIKSIEAHVGEERLVFLIDERVEESIRKLRSLGQLVQDYRYAVTPEGQYRVDTKEDGNVCDITDICLAEDGSLIMSDGANKCLKRLDQKYKVTDRLQFDDHPFGVCSVSAKQVAVTLCMSKVVQLVTLDPIMSLSRSFKTTDRCRDIAHHADHLYVVCGGRQHKGEGPSQIEVYSISGTLVRKLETNHQDQEFDSFIAGVAVRSTDGIILVCDRFNELVALRHDGKRLWTITCKDLEVDEVHRVSVDSHGQALVSSLTTNKVVLVSRDGRKLGVVLAARDGMNKPNALYFDKHRSYLTVGMHENNQISVFKLV